MSVFHRLLLNSLVTVTKNNFVWFGLTYFLYLQTRSVLATSIFGGAFLVVNAITSMWFGSLVDHHRKKTVLVGSSIASLIFFTVGFAIFATQPAETFTQLTHPMTWVLSFVLLCGVVVGGLYNIAVPTLITELVPEDGRDKANGLFGSAMGVGFAITSVASGLTLGFAGMQWVLISAVALTILTLLDLFFIPLPATIHAAEGEHHSGNKRMDIRGTIKAIREIPGLFALIFFTTFNNFLGGVFMSLMDAYGLSLVSVQTWGLLWGGLSFGFIAGGLLIAKRGLGSKPIKMLFRYNIIMWTSSIFFTIQPSIVLLSIGVLIWILLIPFIEATEQTVIQKVVPLKRQGRVFGFAHSIEQAASPLTAFMIGPIAQFIFIPLFSEGGAGASLIGEWYGIGPARGMGMVFSLAGVFGLLVTLIAMRLPAYSRLAKRFSDTQSD